MKIKTVRLKGNRSINNAVSAAARVHGPDANYSDMSDANLRGINIFLGRNGAGKSTYLDCIRALDNPGLLSELRPDMLGADSFHGTDIFFEDGKYVHFQFENQAPREILLRHFSCQLRQDILGEAYLKTRGRFIPPSELQKAKDFTRTLGMKVLYWRGPDQAICDANFVQALTDFKDELVGLDSIYGSNAAGPIFCNLELFFKTDPAVKQTVAFKELPSGWKAAGGLVGFVASAVKDSVVVIEEPETHLHPRLQRLVAQKLAELQATRQLQLVIATHSPIFMNEENWKSDTTPSVDIAIFNVDGNTVASLNQGGSKSLAEAFSDIGANVSDLLQSNAVIWVEGPSDRIYINYWLEKWSQKSKKRLFRENMHYTYCLYGGSILSHFDASPRPTDLISMLRVNRNSFIVIDRDLDFSKAQNTQNRLKDSSPKYSAIDALPKRYWLTSGYTMESYLPKTYLDDKYLEIVGDRLTVTKKLSKVELAQKYKADTRTTDFKDLFNPLINSPDKEIEQLHAFITAANR